MKYLISIIIFIVLVQILERVLIKTNYGDFVKRNFKMNTENKNLLIHSILIFVVVFVFSYINLNIYIQAIILAFIYVSSIIVRASILEKKSKKVNKIKK